MGLVDYSDSDVSDTEDASTPKPAPTSSTTKPTFQKVVDRSNPGKIRVSLPQTASIGNDDEPPTKRAKLGGGGGGFGGFNSFLPAPKRTGVAGSAVSLGGGNGAKKVGLGAGVSLKTGAAPGFSREPEAERKYEEADEREGTSSNETKGSGLSLPPPKATSNSTGEQKPAEEVKLVGKPLMFRPLSVARKPTKKKKPIPTITPDSVSSPVPSTPQPKAEEKRSTRPKVSLFSLGADSTHTTTPATKGDYQPMVYDPSASEEAGEEEASTDFHEPSYEDYTPTTSQYAAAPPFVPTPPVSQSLDDIAGDLNLSAAERRQLFGRQKGGQSFSATKIINFNTDKEYQHNEDLRAAGEQVVHNPVRSIAPGKHSLKQLVNAAQTQKEALEESFAKGKSNRAEASSRYGW